jgi:hypothetical protein
VVFDFIFLGLFFAGWLICGFVPWLALSVATRGNAGLRYLPLCLLAGVTAGLAVPLLGLDDSRGLWLSFAAAFAVPSLLLAARRLSLGAASRPERAAQAAPPRQPE